MVIVQNFTKETKKKTLFVSMTKIKYIIEKMNMSVQKLQRQCTTNIILITRPPLLSFFTVESTTWHIIFGQAT